MLVRKENWVGLFDEFVFKHKDKKFEWGKWDCCIFSNALIRHLTGGNVIPKTLKWTDKKSALESISEYGGDLNGAIKKATKNKLLPVNKNYIQKTDLIVYKQESQLVGIFDGFKILGPSDEGIIGNQYEKILSAYRIPHRATILEETRNV